MITIKQFIEFGTPEYHESIRLRNAILRLPLKLEFTEGDLAAEYDSTHIGCYDEALELVGCLVMKHVDDQVVKMRQVAVVEQMQGKGIGKSLVRFSEIWAKDAGYTKIVLHARLEAVPFYLNMQYQKVGDQFEEVSIPHFKMEKKL